MNMGWIGEYGQIKGGPWVHETHHSVSEYHPGLGIRVLSFDFISTIDEWCGDFKKSLIREKGSFNLKFKSLLLLCSAGE